MKLDAEESHYNVMLVTKKAVVETIYGRCDLHTSVNFDVIYRLAVAL